MSTSILFNIEMAEEGDTTPKIKWATPLDTVVILALDYSDERVFAIEVDMSLNKSKLSYALPEERMYGFRMDSGAERALWVADFRRCFRNAAGRDLAVFDKCPDVAKALTTKGLDIASTMRSEGEMSRASLAQHSMTQRRGRKGTAKSPEQSRSRSRSKSSERRGGSEEECRGGGTGTTSERGGGSEEGR
mmetsp:Transcript_76234/g.178841  ORF Transcript_76234/g.178841 Transcript_76234/m.178841 type:complete len:190 (+) Transcript_76234:23-592(+)